MRKMPNSAKDLYNEHIEWMDEDEECLSPRKERRGMTVTDIYKMEVLGEGNISGQDNTPGDFTSFSNSNILKYTYKTILFFRYKD